MDAESSLGALAPVVPKSESRRPILLIAPLLILPVILLAAIVPSQPSCSLQRGDGGDGGDAGDAAAELGLHLAGLQIPDADPASMSAVLLSMPPVALTAAQKEDVVPGFDAQPDSQQPIFVSIELVHRIAQNYSGSTRNRCRALRCGPIRFEPLACFGRFQHAGVAYDYRVPRLGMCQKHQKYPKRWMPWMCLIPRNSLLQE